MRIRTTTTICLILVLLLPGINGQDAYLFDQLTVNEGLSQNTVNKVLKDSRGFIWVATNDGLNRYDGYEFISYQFRFDDSTSISNNRIEELCEDNDGNLWVGTRGGVNRYDRAMDHFIRYAMSDSDSPGDQNDFIRSMVCDSAGNLWIGTMGGGLNLLARGSGEIISLNPGTTGPDANLVRDLNISDLYLDAEGSLWVATNSSGINKYDAQSNTYTYHAIPTLEKGSLPLGMDKTIFQDSEGYIWVCTMGAGVIRLDHTTGEFHRFFTGDPGSFLRSDIVKDIIEYDGLIWIATDGGGMHLYNSQDQCFDVLEMDPEKSGSLNSKAIYSLYSDDQDILWVGTFNGGINKYDPNLRKFEHHHPQPGSDNTLSHPSVLCFEEDGEGNIYIGTDGGGLNLFDPVSKEYTWYCSNSDLRTCLNSNAVTSLFRDQANRIWVGTYNGGLHLFDPVLGVLKKYTHEVSNPNSLINDNVWTILEDSYGEFWVGTSEGLQRFDPVSGQFYTVPKVNRSTVGFQNRINNIYEDRMGQLWFCGETLYRLNSKGDSLVYFPFSSFVQERIRNMDIRSVYQDHNDHYWICTEGAGLVFYDPALDSSRIYSTQDGLPNNSVHRILEDDQGFFWISTNNGLCRFFPSTGEFRNYDLHDGLQSNQYSFSAALEASDGTFYFGGVNGFNSFKPDGISLNAFVPPVVLTGFSIFNRPVVVGEKKSPLESHISETGQITLKHSQSVFTFQFASLNYTAPERNRYKILMEGFEDEWREIGTQRTATFTNLDAGRYTFRVKASNNDLIWNEVGVSLPIRVLPPWWRSWYAYLAYGLLIFSILLQYRRSFLRQARLKHDLKLKDLEKQQIEELNQMELRFFTNISHEFKTPLTLIQGPLEQIISKGTFDPKVEKQLGMMRTNVSRLLRLIGQLMEFRKVKQSTLELKVRKGDIVDYLKRIKGVFEDLAEQRSIKFSFISNSKAELTWFDPDKIEIIIYNLLSNAFKYTPEGGTIDLLLDVKSQCEIPVGGKCFEISVKDSGIGIPEDKLASIFDRFYQVDQGGSFMPTSDKGTGIGLSLTKTLVEKHHGIIWAISESRKGTCFSFSIPYSLEQYDSDEVLVDDQDGQLSVKLRPDKALYKKSAEITDEGLQIRAIPEKEKDGVILVVEDNPEVLQFLIGTLEQEFSVIGAKNGAEGLKFARSNKLDIVITDIMMPVMNGLEFCTKLKTNESTSHIPVIMLTAKGEADDRIAGLKEGADDYILKPFNPEELLQKIRNILRTRSSMWEKFSHQISIEPSDITVSSFDEKFMAATLQIVEDHMDDPEFDVSALVNQVGMSRSVLYRKLKALTGQSAKEFINTIRLKRAAQLLQKNKLSVSEITYMVGYSDPQYFSKCFKKQFRKTPSQFAAEAKSGSRLADAGLE